ncbi:membrane metallo-endopeptidase-like 1 [Scaptodrosophila lebanonensis]|uniref:Membrane metallo-endopeptidase-like 1 n=1 Tax=Drosophila lebanonensis TaxID=7225 RepID=A0A6J2TP20_DROLE|nr:membrane metallo-endopeptidase-like 1 [Scaptodrosophila lebanonensis]
MGNRWIIAGLVGLLVAATASPTAQVDVNEKHLSEILSYMNESADACDDFFNYACGNWSEQHLSLYYTEIMGEVDLKVNKNLVKLMDKLAVSLQNSNHDDSNSVEDKVWRYYQTCRGASLDTRNLKHYLDFVQPGEQVPWPQLAVNSKQWPKNKFNWLETLGRLQRYSLNNVLMRSTVVPSYKNSRKYVIDLDRPVFKEKNQRLRGNFSTKNILLQLGVPKGSALNLARKVYQLELLVRDLTEGEDLPNDNLALHELERTIQAPWRKYFEIVLGHSVPRDFKVQISNVDYFEALVELLSRQEPNVVASYIMVRFIIFLREESMGIDEPIECIQDVRRNLDLAINLLYEEHFYESNRQKNNEEVTALFEILRAQFLTGMDGNVFNLNATQRELLRNKTRSMDINIGNMPKGVNHRKFVTNFYRELSLSESDYEENHLKVLQFRAARLIEKLDQQQPSHTKFALNDDGDYAMSSSPFYLQQLNLIVVPFGLLQEPVFNADMHDIFKISLLGFMIAHEIIHGFDSTGLGYDAKALDCINRNETDNLDERIADISGIRLAFDAYFAPGSKYSQAHPTFTTLPLKKIFFLNLAQFFCGSLDTSFMSHDPDDVRIKQLLINFPPFAETYGCRQGQDIMHPAEKCRLWR